MYNSAILKAHYAYRSFLEVPIISDSSDEENLKLSAQYKTSGTPFVIRNHKGWAKFSYRWLKRENSTKNEKVTSLTDHKNEINLATLIKDIGHEKVPVVTPDYDSENPIKGFITVKE